MDAQGLFNCIREGGTPHAILIAGTEGSGRAALARRAAAVYCIGEDAPEKLAGSPHYAELSGESVGVAEVRGLMAATAMQGFNGQRRAFVLVNAHRMSPQSQNALLKTLEEPPADTLLLLSGSEQGLLPTVRSRCMIMRLGALPIGEAAAILGARGVAPDTARLAAALAGGVTERAMACADAEYLRFRQEALKLFDRALFDESPFSECTALITVTGGDEGQSADAEPKKRGKKADAGLAGSLLGVWQSLARDALLAKLGGGERANIDADAQISRIAARFTSGEIQGIIDILGEAQKRLFAKASPRTTLDVMLARLHIKEITTA